MQLLSGCTVEPPQRSLGTPPKGGDLLTRLREKIGVVTVRLRFLFPILTLIALATLPAYSAGAASSPDADAKTGAILFRDKGCAYCHGANLEGTKKAPALSEIRRDKDWTTEKMTDQILDGGQKMPPFRESLTDEEIAQLIAYLRAKNRPVAPPSANPTPAPAMPTPQ